MNRILVCAAALSLFLGDQAGAQDSSPIPAPSAQMPAPATSSQPASPSPAQSAPPSALPAPASPAAGASPSSQTARTPETLEETAQRRGGRRHRESYRSLFRNWCAYNCYAVPRCHGPSCYGRYGYSHFAYDEDIPFRHRWDRDASPIDNADAYVYRYTGELILRAFERLY